MPIRKFRDDVDYEIPEGGMSQTEVAAVLGISKSRVSQIEIQALRKVARAMGVEYHPRPFSKPEGRHR